MQGTSEVWRSLWASGTARLEARAIIDGAVYEGVAPTVNRALMQSGPQVGNAAAAMCTLAVRTDAAIPRSAEVRLQMRLTDGEAASEWLPAGTYYISRRSRDPVTGVMTLECYDGLLKANALWEPSEGEWPRSPAAVVAELAALLGVEVDGRTALAGEGYAVGASAAGTAIREVLGGIAAYSGGNWILTPANALRLVPFAPEAGDAVAVEAVTGGIDAGEAGTVTGIRCAGDGETVMIGDDGGIVIDVSIAPVQAAALAERLVGAEYRPFSLQSAHYDPAAELGDAVSYGGEALGVLCAETAALGPAFHGDISAPACAELADEYPYIGGDDKLLAAAQAYTRQAVEGLDSGLTQQEIFDRLTNGGEAQGLVMADGQLYVNASYINTGTLSAERIEVLDYNADIHVANELNLDSMFEEEAVDGEWIVNNASGDYPLRIFWISNAEKYRGKTGSFTAILDAQPGPVDQSWGFLQDDGQIGEIYVEPAESGDAQKTYGSPEDAAENGDPDPSGDTIGVVHDGDTYVFTGTFKVPNNAYSWYSYGLKFNRIRSISVKFDEEPGARNRGLMSINSTGLQIGDLAIDTKGNLVSNADMSVGGVVSLENPLPVASGGTGLTKSPSMLTNLGSTTAANVLQASPRPGVTGTLPVGNGGTGLTKSPSLLINLGSTTAANVLQASPRPGVTGTLSIDNGGTGLTASPSMLINLASTTAANVLQASPRPGVTGALPIANGGTGKTKAADAWTALGGGESGKHPDSYFALASHTHSYLPLSGGTLTGNLTIKASGTATDNTAMSIIGGKTNNSTYTTEDGATVRTIYDGTWTRLYFQNRYKSVTGGTTTWYPSRIYFRQWSATASSGTRLSNYETYYLPNTADGLTANKSYSILTTKSLVTVAQGGTGASTAAVNKVFAGPSSGSDAAAPGFRSLVAADIPSLAASKVTSGTFDAARIPTLSITDKTSGTLTVARGGTGATTYTGALSNLGIKHKSVSGTTTSRGNISLGLTGSRYQIISVQCTTTNRICTVYLGESSEWGAHVTDIAATPAAIASTSVKLNVVYIDYGSNI